MILAMTNTQHPADATCQGVPPGFESACLIPGPHGPHGPEAPAVIMAGERVRKIAAIHALADWYQANPDQPMPAHIIATTRTYNHQGPEVDRVLAVLDFARRAGVDAEETWDEVKARVVLVRQEGMTIAVSSSAALSPSSAHRYV
jgi:hypothetical protein